MLNKPIFILGAHKSGTSLLRSLFDGHPELFTIPIEAHFFQLMRYWIDYAFIKKHQPTNISQEVFIANAIDLIKYANSDSNPLGDCISKNVFNTDEFEKYISLHPSQLVATGNRVAYYFEIYVKAIYYSIYGKELDSKMSIVEKSVETAEFALDLQQMFPEALFIHIIRNPYANLISMKKFRMHNKKTQNHPWLGKDFRSLYNSYYFLYRNQRLIKNYLVVKYEDLVTEPESVIKDLCQFTQIKFNEQMLIPTYLGNKWQGNSSSSEKFQGISADKINQWKNNIDPLITQLINKYFTHILKDFDYQIQTSQRSVFFPNKREFPAEYIANRFLWFAR